MDDENVSGEARRMLEQISRQNAESDFDLFCRFFPENGDLEEACWALAAALQPEANLHTCKARLNSWGRSLLVKITGAISTRERIRILADFFSAELEFRGNSEDYYNPKNSLLPAVIETRCGLPILLSCIAIFLSHRAGLNVVGVNLPGHFIVRHGDILFDPFHRCKILTRSDCDEILRCQGIVPDEQCYRTASSRRVLQRILCNLHFSFSKTGDCEKTAKVRHWIEALRRER